MAEDNGNGNGIGHGAKQAASTIQNAIPPEIKGVFGALQESVSGLTQVMKGNVDIVRRSIDATKKGMEDLGSLVESELSQSPVLFALYNIMKGTVKDSLLLVKRSLGLAEATVENSVGVEEDTPQTEVTIPEDETLNVHIVSSDLPLVPETPTIEDMREQDRDEKTLIKAVQENTDLLRKGHRLELKRKRQLSLQLPELASFGKMTGAVALGNMLARVVGGITSAVKGLGALMIKLSGVGKLFDLTRKGYERIRYGKGPQKELPIKKPKVPKKGLMGLLGRAVPWVAIIASLASGIFSGFSAMADSIMKGEGVLTVLKEGLFGFVSGLTFGLFSKEKIAEIVDWVGNTAFPAIKDATVNFFTETIPAIFEYTKKNIWPAITEFISNRLSDVGVVFGWVWDGVKSLAQTMGEKLAAGGDWAEKAFLDFAFKLGNSIMGVLDPIFESIRTIKEDLILWVNDKTSSLFGGLFEDEAKAIRERRELERKLENSNKGAGLSGVMENAALAKRQAERDSLASSINVANSNTAITTNNNNQNFLGVGKSSKRAERSSSMQQGYELAMAR